MNTLQSILTHSVVWKVGWVLLHSVWQITIVAAVLAVALGVLREASASVRYLVSCTALVLIVTLPVGTLCLVEAPPADAVPTWSTVAPGPTAPATSAQVTSIVPPPAQVAETPAAPGPVAVAETLRPSLLALATDKLDTSLPYLVIAWLLGVFGLSLWHLGGWAQLQRLKRRMVEPVTNGLKERTAALAELLGIRRAVTVVQSALVQVPTVVGWLRPVVLLPVGALTGLSTAQLEALLAHELAHVRRHDYLVNMVQTAIEILGFYHPAVWLVSRRIRIERENCCDDIAAGVTGDRVLYADALATMEELRGGPRLALAASGGSLLARIRRLCRREAEGASRAAWLPSLLALGMLALVLLAGRGMLADAMPEENGADRSESAIEDNPLGLEASVLRKLFIAGKTLRETAGECERFRDKHGHWPTNTDQLHEGEPSEPRRDPFHDGPYHITIHSNDVPAVRIWSVGPDGDWDGGRPIDSSKRGLDGDIAIEMSVKPELRWLADETMQFYLEGHRLSHYLASLQPPAPPPVFPEEEGEYAWGEVVDGLQAALEIVPQRDSYALGEALEIQFRIRNAGRRTLKIAGDTWRQGDMLTLTDENGKSVEVGGCWYSGWSESKRETLKPGRTAVFKASGLAFVKPDDNDRPGHPVAKYVECEPGRYTLQFRLKFPDLGGGELDLPQPEDWQGTLTTGAHGVTVESPREKGVTANSLPGLDVPIGDLHLEPGWSVTDTLADIAKRGGIPLRIDPAGLQDPATGRARQCQACVKLKGAQARDALAWVLHVSGISAAVSDGRLHVRASEGAASVPMELAIRPQPAKVGDVLSAELRKKTTRLEGLDPWNARQLFEFLCYKGDIANRVFASDVGGAGSRSVTVKFVDVPFAEVFDRALADTGCELLVDRNTVFFRRFPVHGALRVSGRITDAETGAPVPEFRAIPGIGRRGDRLALWDRDRGVTGSKGNYEITFDERERKDAGGIRIEAKGYLVTETSVLAADPSGRLDIELTRGTPLTGRVLLPDGRPAVGADIVPSTLAWGTIINGRPPPIPGKYLLRTDENGAFALAGRDVPFLATALHEAGYAELIWAEAGGDATASLLPWARVTGAVHSGPSPETKLEIGLAVQETLLAKDRPSGLRKPHFGYKTTVDERGRFEFDRVPAGRVSVRPRRGATPGASSFLPTWVPLNLKPGETLHVEHGEAGRSVTGRIAPPPGMEDVELGNCWATMSQTGPPLSSGLSELPEAERSARLEQWRQSDEWRVAEREYWGGSHRFLVPGKGTFRVDGVPPGRYRLSGALHRRTAERSSAKEQVWSFEHAFEVQALSPGETDKPLDLGTLTAKPAHREEGAATSQDPSSSNLVIRIRYANTSWDKARTVPVRRELPSEIRRKDIVDPGGLQVAYDKRADAYYLFEDAVTIGPQEVLVCSVQLRDAWNTNAPAIASLETRLAGMASEAPDALRPMIEELRREAAALQDGAPTELSDKYIVFYRQQAAAIRRIQAKVDRIENAVKPEPGGAGIVRLDELMKPRPPSVTITLVAPSTVYFRGQAVDVTNAPALLKEQGVGTNEVFNVNVAPIAALRQARQLYLVLSKAGYSRIGTTARILSDPRAEGTGDARYDPPPAGVNPGEEPPAPGGDWMKRVRLDGLHIGVNGVYAEITKLRSADDRRPSRGFDIPLGKTVDGITLRRAEVNSEQGKTAALLASGGEEHWFRGTVDTDHPWPEPTVLSNAYAAGTLQLPAYRDEAGLKKEIANVLVEMAERFDVLLLTQTVEEERDCPYVPGALVRNVGLRIKIPSPGSAVRMADTLGPLAEWDVLRAVLHPRKNGYNSGELHLRYRYSKANDSGSIRLTVEKDGSVLSDGEPVESGWIEERGKAAERTEAPPVLITVHRETPYSNVVAVLNACKEAGFTSIALSVTREESTPDTTARGLEADRERDKLSEEAARIRKRIEELSMYLGARHPEMLAEEKRLRTVETELAAVSRVMATDAPRGRFLEIEHIARLPKAEQAGHLERLYAELAPRYMNEFVTGILSVYPRHILNRDIKHFDGNSERWAQELADAAAELSPAEVADKLERPLWQNVAARARAMQVFNNHGAAVTALIEADLASREKVRVARAAGTILTLKLRDFTDDLLDLFLANEEASEATYHALLSMRDPRIVKPLLAKVEKNHAVLIRCAGLLQAPYYRKPAEPLLLKLLESPDKELRYGAIRAVYECRDPRLAPLIVKFAGDEESRFRVAAAYMARKLPNDAFRSVREQLLPLLRDEDEAVRMGALQSFARQKDPAAGPVILELLRRDRLGASAGGDVIQALSALAGDTFGYDMHNWGPAKRGNRDAIRRVEAWLSSSGTIPKADAASTPDTRVLKRFDKAITDGDRKTAGRLLYANPALVNAFVSRPTKGGQMSAFLAAVQEGDVEVVRLFLDHGAKLTGNKGQGKAAFHIAVGHGHADIVDLLIDRGVDPRAPNASGESALHIAAARGNADMIALLLKRGLDVNGGNALGPYGELALHWALARGNAGVANLLISAGSDAKAATKAQRADMNAKAGDIDLIEQEIGFLEVSKKPVQVMAPVRMAFAIGDTPLHCVMQPGPRHRFGRGGSQGAIDRAKLAQALVEKGADVNAKNARGQTPLHYAVVLLREKTVVEELIRLGADPAAKTEDGRTAIELARRAGATGIAGALLAGGATPQGISVLSPGDLVEVRLTGIPKPATIRDLVDEKGCISLPDLGSSIHVAGRTTSEAERKIEQLYVDGGHHKELTVVILKAVPAEPGNRASANTAH